jgi:hypothetical protein
MATDTKVYSQTAKLGGSPAEVNPGQAPKLTDWANEPTCEQLKQDFANCKSSHDTHALRIKEWKESAEGKDAPKKVKGRSSVQPKLVRRQAEWRYSALSEPFNSSEDLFAVAPVTFEDGNSARQNQTVLNWQFRTKIDRVALIDDLVRSDVDEGTAIIRVGWCRYTKKEKQMVPVWAYYPAGPEDMQKIQSAYQLKQSNPRAYNESVDPAIQESLNYTLEKRAPFVAVQAGEEEVEVDVVVENYPTAEVINPLNLYWDPTCGSNFNKATFAIFSFETSQAELKKEPDRYKNLEYVNWEGATTVLDADHQPNSIDTNFNFTDPMRKRVVAYEYWGLWDIHKTGELVPIVATYLEGVIIRMELNPFADKKPPFILVPYMPIKRQAVGEADAALLQDNQKVLGAVTRGMIDLLGRSANSQQGFAKGMLDSVNRRRFETGQDYEFNPNVNPAMGHIQHTYPEIPQSAIVMLQLQNQEAEALTGVKAFSGGLSGEAYGDVAAGIKGILDAAAKREMAILRRLAKGVKEMGRKIADMNAMFMSEEETIRVTNTEFVTVKREDLAGNFDLKVDISTAEIDNAKVQDLAFMLQTIGPKADFKFVKMILIEIARLKRMPELVKQLQDYEPQPDPLLEKLKELQVQKEAKEIEKLQSEIDLNRAKMQQAIADAHQTSLDAIEQETGTKHARELEKQAGQARGNQDLEITKALTKPLKEGERPPNVEAGIGWNAISKRMADPRNGNGQVPMLPALDFGQPPALIQ